MNSILPKNCWHLFINISLIYLRMPTGLYFVWQLSEIIIFTYICYCFDTGVVLYFSVVLRSGSPMSSSKLKISLLRVTLRFVTALAKNSSNTSAVLALPEITSFPLTFAIFSGTLHLLDMVSQFPETFYYHEFWNPWVTKLSYDIELRKMTPHIEFITRWLNFYLSTFELLTPSSKIISFISRY